MKHLVAAAALFVASLVTPNLAFGQSCRALDSLSANAAAEIRRIATTDNAIRDTLHLPLVTPDQVALVTDTAVCSQVRIALDSMIRSNTPDAINLGPRAIYAIRVGTYYAAINPGSKAGEYIPIFFFNNSLAFLRILLF